MMNLCFEGILVARGNETNYITFNSSDANKRWKGLNFQKPISRMFSVTLQFHEMCLLR